jgi:hypothetical protein
MNIHLCQRTSIFIYKNNKTKTKNGNKTRSKTCLLILQAMYHAETIRLTNKQKIFVAEHTLAYTISSKDSWYVLNYTRTRENGTIQKYVHCTVHITLIIYSMYCSITVQLKMLFKAKENFKMECSHSNSNT